MIKFVFVLFASALLVEGIPVFQTDLAEAAKNDNWDQFRTLLVPGLALKPFIPNWPTALSGSVESLKPSDGTHVYGHAISAYKEWKNENGNLSQNSKGVEIENNDGQVSKRTFKP